MSVHTVMERGGVFYLLSVRPETFALGVYSVMMSFLGANLLWIYALLLCMSLDHLNLVRTVDRLIGIQIIFASVTTFLWWLIYSEKGKCILSHTIFYIWFGAKTMSAVLELLFFPQFYRRIFHSSVPVDLDRIVGDLTWGAVTIVLIEGLGLFFTQKHYKDLRARGRSPKMGKACTDKTFNV